MKMYEKKKSGMRISACILAMILLFAALPAQASAASIDVPDSLILTLYASKDLNAAGDSKSVSALTLISSGKVTGLKSNDTSIVKIYKNTVDDGTEILLLPKKTGTTKVSFKVGNKKYTTKITVKKYVNPISSVTVGDTKISSSKFKTLSYANLKYADYKGKKVKVTFQLKSGWSLTSGYINVFYANSKTTSVKNGKKITISGGKGCALLVLVQKDSTGQTELINLNFK
ncbi:MAG: hypothetical protein LUI07_02920 [Lachnospiraceae bacterium]|nr:hypothetical protein [Lachnospiraceae bacterium]